MYGEIGCSFIAATIVEREVDLARVARVDRRADVGLPSIASAPASRDLPPLLLAPPPLLPPELPPDPLLPPLPPPPLLPPLPSTPPSSPPPPEP